MNDESPMPHTGLKQKLDYSDYAGIPSDGKTYEILDGEVFVTPAPSPQHQRLSKRLQRQLESWFEDRSIAEVFDAPIDLILGPHDIVQPDLVVVADARQVSKRGIEGAPLLVVEIVSPSSRSRDRGLKGRRYAELGIPHYWIVDPEARSIECYRAREGKYEPIARADGSAPLEHPDWAGWWVDLAALWR